MIRKLIIILILLPIVETAFAVENNRISIAVMEFRANNTTEGFGKASMDMLSERLFASKLFTLMEKSQMDRIARLNGFNEFNLADPRQIAKLGRLLKVDKMIVGSITYLDSFILDVKVLNGVTGEIEYNVNKKISSIDKLENAIDDISLSIERYCLGYYNLTGNFDISFEMLYLEPMGTLSRVVTSGTGINAVMTINSPLGVLFNIDLLTGFYSYSPEYKSINYFYMVPLYLSLSYKISLARNIKIFPSAGLGYVFSKISINDSRDTDSLYWQEKSFYYNPAAVIRVEFDILLFDRWFLVVTPQYNAFFEEEEVGQFASLGLGLKMLF